jgi:hypothetical protein
MAGVRKISQMSDPAMFNLALGELELFLVWLFDTIGLGFLAAEEKGLG